MSSLKNRNLSGPKTTVELDGGDQIVFSIKPITQRQRIEWNNLYPNSEDPKSMDAINTGFLVFLHYIDSRTFEEELTIENMHELTDSDLQKLSEAIKEQQPSKKE